MYGPYPDRYPTVMSNLIYTGMTAAQASDRVAQMLSKGSVDLSDWHELSKHTDTEQTKGDKRNGTMSRQQAFGGLARKRGIKWK